MYAVIRAGGKQHKVSEGDVIEVERLKDGSGDVEFVPLLVVDDSGKTFSARDELAQAVVKASVLGETKGSKIDVFKYRSKSRYRRSMGHRQRYTALRIETIAAPGGRSKKKTTARKSTARRSKAGEQKAKETGDGS